MSWTPSAIFDLINCFTNFSWDANEFLIAETIAKNVWNCKFDRTWKKSRVLSFWKHFGCFSGSSSDDNLLEFMREGLEEWIAMPLIGVAAEGVDGNKTPLLDRHVSCCQGASQALLLLSGGLKWTRRMHVENTEEHCFMLCILASAVENNTLEHAWRECNLGKNVQYFAGYLGSL